MAHIDYYFSTVSPWAYLAGNRLEEIAARHGATITYKPIDLGSLFPAHRRAAAARTAPVAAGVPAAGTRPAVAQARDAAQPQAGLLAGERRARGLRDHRGAGGRRGRRRARAGVHARLLGRGAGHRRGRDDPRLPLGHRLRPAAGRQGPPDGRRDLRPQHRGGGGARASSARRSTSSTRAEVLGTGPARGPRRLHLCAAKRS